MADSLENDFALSDFEEVAGAEENGDARPAKRTANRDADNEEETEEEKRARKKRKMRQQDKSRKAKKAAVLSAGGPGILATLPPDMQADHLRKIVRSCKQFSKMSDLELDEIGIQESMLLDVTAVKSGRKLENIVDFVKTTSPITVKEFSRIAHAESGLEGQPALLVITGDAQRAADLAKVLRNLISKGSEQSLPVAKLFARHFKIAEQEAFLQSSACPIAVGTPKRVHDLMQSGDGKAKLKLDRLRMILLDASWTDAKMRTLLDGNETKGALCSLLACDAIKSRLKSKKKEERAVVALY